MTSHDPLSMTHRPGYEARIYAGDRYVLPGRYPDQDPKPSCRPLANCNNILIQDKFIHWLVLIEKKFGTNMESVAGLTGSWSRYRLSAKIILQKKVARRPPNMLKTT